MPAEQPTREAQYLRRSEFSQLDSPAFNDEPPAPAFDLNLRRNLRVYRKQATVVGLVIFFLLMVMGLSMQSRYHAQALLFVEPIKPSVMPSEGAANILDPTRYLAVIAQLTSTMKRPDLLAAAVEKMPAGVWRAPGEPVGSAAARLGAGLTVERETMSFQLTVGLSGSDAKQTPEALNILLRQFLEEQNKVEDANWNIRIALLSKEHDNLDRDLADTRDRLVQVNTLLGIGSFTAEARNPIDDQIADLKKQLDEAHRDRDAAAATLASGQGDLTAQADPEDVQFQQGIESRKSTLRQQMSGMTPLNPLYKQNEEELAALDKQVAAEKERGRQRDGDRLRDKIRQADVLITALQNRVSQQSAHLVASAPLLQRAAELTSRVREMETNLHQVDTALRTARLEKDSPSAVRIVSLATEPAPKETSRQMLFLAAAVPLGLIGAAVTACVLGMVQMRVFGSADVERAVGFSPVAVVPSESDAGDGVRKEYFLRIASSIESAYRRTGAHVFVFTAVGAARSEAVPDLTMLMQGVRQQLFDLGYAPLWMSGSALLSDERAFEADYGEGAENNRVTAKSGESVSASRLRWLLTQYDLILIEAEPLLSSAMAEYAARSSDVTIAVAASGLTPTSELTEAVHLLGRLQVPSVGIIVDDLKVKNSDSTYRSRLSMAARRMNSDTETISFRRPEDADGTNGVSRFRMLRDSFF